MKPLILILSAVLALLAEPVASADLPQTIRQVKPSVVAVGTFQALRGQQDRLLGTGFVVAGGSHVVTNSHVVPDKLDEGRRETVAVYVPAEDNRAQRRNAKVVRRDKAHDLCVLRIEGPGLRSLRLGRTGDVKEGEPIAFTGFPILGVLGLHPATHRGIVAAVTPYIMPVTSGKQLNPDVLKRLAKPFDIFQLDATAYPGNSGSPLYEPDSGRVLGVINSVFVKQSKEMAITDPSGITYAIPVDYVRALLDAAGLKY
jgi:S1-C subfamily serine protease